MSAAREAAPAGGSIDPGSTLPFVDDAHMQSRLQERALVWVVLLKAGERHADPTTVPAQWEHARHMFQRLRAGHLEQVSALPLSPELLGVAMAPPGMGEASLRAIFDADPAVASGRASYELHQAIVFSASDLQS